MRRPERTLVRLAALNRALAAQETLTAATAGTNIDWTMLAAIGIRESGFKDGNERDGAGVGVGIFEITNGGGIDAHNLAAAAGWAVNYLTHSSAVISNAIPGLPAGLAVWMLAASWNTGEGGQISRYLHGYSADYQTAPIGNTRVFRNDYGSNVLGLMDCFQ